MTVQKDIYETQLKKTNSKLSSLSKDHMTLVWHTSILIDELKKVK